MRVSAPDHIQLARMAGSYDAALPQRATCDAPGRAVVARIGRREEAEEVLNDLLRLEQERYVPPTHIAIIYAALGHKKRALESLELAFSGKDASFSDPWPRSRA